MRSYLHALGRVARLAGGFEHLPPPFIFKELLKSKQLDSHAARYLSFQILFLEYPSYPIHLRTVGMDERTRTDGVGVCGRILTAKTMTAHNTFEQPYAVRPAPCDGARRPGQTLTVELPPKSPVVLALQ